MEFESECKLTYFLFVNTCILAYLHTGILAHRHTFNSSISRGAFTPNNYKTCNRGEGFQFLPRKSRQERLMVLIYLIYNSLSSNIYMAHRKVNSPKRLENGEIFFWDTPSKLHKNASLCNFFYIFLLIMMGKLQKK